MDNGQKYDEELLSLLLTQCANCNAFCSEGQQLCHRCALMRCCQWCRRILPDVCFGQADEDTCEVIIFYNLLQAKVLNVIIIIVVVVCFCCSFYFMFILCRHANAELRQSSSSDTDAGRR